MEVMYPIIIIIGFVIAIYLYFKNINKKEKYTEGTKVANTSYIKETEYYLRLTPDIYKAIINKYEKRFIDIFNKEAGYFEK